MHQTGQVQYCRDALTGAEWILCTDSAISYPLHNHVSVYTAGIVLHGTIVLELDNVSLSLCTGDTFLIPPYLPHRLHSDGRYSLLTLCIQKDRMAGCGSGAVAQAINCLIASLPEGTLSEAQHTALLRRMLMLEDAPYTLPSEPWIGLVRTLLERHPEKKLGIDEMARRAHISKYHFIRSFRRSVGLTPHQFQIQNRVRKAQRLLPYTECFTQVDFTVGFCDQSHLIREFEKWTGLTPTAYRSSCRHIPHPEDAVNLRQG